MPAKTPRQRKAAGAELGRRRSGKASPRAAPFASAKTSDIRHFAKKPNRGKKGK